MESYINRRKWLHLMLIHSGILIPGINFAFAAKPKSKKAMETMKMDKVRSKDGTEIAYWRSGSGPPLVLVHGTTADHTRWAPVLSPFENKFTVYAMDRRGRGESGDARNYEIHREFEDIAAVVNIISEPVNLLGHSFGALCCMEAALLSDNLNKLILYEPPISNELPLFPPAVLEQIQELIKQNKFEEALNTFFRKVAQVPEIELEYLRSLPVWKVRVAAAYTIPREMKEGEKYQFNSERFKNISFPTALLVGGDSPPLYKNAIEKIQAAIPGSQTYLMPGQQHTAMNTAPELFIKTVMNFLLKD